MAKKTEPSEFTNAMESFFSTAPVRKFAKALITSSDPQMISFWDMFVNLVNNSGLKEC